MAGRESVPPRAGSVLGAELTLLPAGTSWYSPQNMLPPGNRSQKMIFRLAACLLLAAAAGCGGGPPWFRGQEGPLLDPVKVSELRPGCYCEIDMVVPPTASDGSFDCFKGTVKEITHDEVVLTSVVEERCVHYGANPHPHPLMQRNRDLVRVPLTGVETIWALPPGKDNAAAEAHRRRRPSCLPAARKPRRRPRGFRRWQTMEARPGQIIFRRRPCRKPRHASTRRRTRSTPCCDSRSVGGHHVRMVGPPWAARRPEQARAVPAIRLARILPELHKLVPAYTYDLFSYGSDSDAGPPYRVLILPAANRRAIPIPAG